MLYNALAHIPLVVAFVVACTTLKAQCKTDQYTRYRTQCVSVRFSATATAMPKPTLTLHTQAHTQAHIQTRTHIHTCVSWGKSTFSSCLVR